jgi:transglutaminase-like putative cysteine protease
MSAAAAAPAVRSIEASGPLLPLGAARAATYVGLALFGTLHWVQLTEPAQPRRAVWAVGIGVAACVLLLAAARLPGALRWVAAVAVSAGALALALLAAGIADELLKPARWGELVSGIGRGIEAIPGARVPYRGLDEWTRVSLIAGGTVLAAGAALLAFWPRRSETGFRAAALIVLVGLYATPAVALNFDGEFRRGALLTVLMLAFLRLERVGVRDAPGAAAVTALAAVLALMLAPALDRDTPWWDYETWALSTASSKSTAFAWDHDYGPLDWPRDGRELLRVKARIGTYWKADSLDLFDGHRWRHQPFDTGQAGPQLPDDIENVVQWTQEIQVTVRNLRSRTFVTAGVAESVDFPRRESLPSGVAGIFRAPRTLRRGDAYSAQVYTPRVAGRQLRRAGTFYEDWLETYRQMSLPEAGSPQIRDPATGDLEDSARTRVTFADFASPSPPEARSIRFVGAPPDDARPLLAESALQRTWALSQQLKTGAETPYDYLRAIERHLRRGFTYSETPPRQASTLEGFLFEAKTGYCQQYSGAMALLLRMGGIPARVATGFSPGSLDRKAKEYVVRDFDAHSWVEAWFPGWGWVPFDPTPSTAPPRAQSDFQLSDIAGAGDVRDLGAGDRLDPRTAAADEGGGVPWGTIAALAAAALVLALAARRFGPSLLHHRRRLALTPVVELERALRLTGRTPEAGQTLQALESRLAPGAASYVRAVRDERFGGRPTRPTPAQRRALRAELGHGSIGARLRSWWALPPRPRPRRKAGAGA